MSIEANIERIAVAAERQAAALEGILKTNVMGAQMVLDDVEGTLVGDSSVTETEKPKSYAEQRKEEVAKDATPVGEKKKPGRPAKPKTETVKEPVKTDTPDDEDPFAAEPVADVAETTLDEVRKTLVALREKVGKEKAYAFLREHGAGASFLPGSTASGQTDVGALKPEYFRAVVKAAAKLIG